MQNLLVLLITILSLFIISCSNDSWIKDEKSDCMIHNDSPKDAEYILYQGPCLNGKANGFGKVQWYRDSLLSSEYTGQFVDGKMEGDVSVKYFLPPLEYFRGNFKNDSREGLGTYYYSFGKKVTSNFIFGKRSDSTVISWRSGKKYIGTVDENLVISGLGTMFFPNGDEYSGEFLWNHRNGKGIYIWANGDCYNGEYENDQRKEIGRYSIKDGRTFELNNHAQDSLNFLQKEKATIELKGLLSPEFQKSFQNKIFQALEYPKTLRNAQVEFDFYIRLFFDTTGNIKNYRISDVPPLAKDVSEEAMARILSYNFPISSEEGEIFNFWISIPFRFRFR